MEELTAVQHLAIARHPGRPNVTDYIAALFTDFFEQRGDRLCGEDPAILGGVALFHGHPVTVIGTRKGKNLEENLRCNFGMPSPEGYRKAGGSWNRQRSSAAPSSPSLTPVAHTPAWRRKPGPGGGHCPESAHPQPADGAGGGRGPGRGQ